MKTTTVALKKSGRPRKVHLRKNQLNQITVHLSPELVQALDDETMTLGLRSRSELIREACQAYLEQHHDERRTLSMTQRMRGLSAEERRRLMAQAADALADYYKSDPEIAAFHALDGERVYDAAE